MNGIPNKEATFSSRIGDVVLDHLLTQRSLVDDVERFRVHSDVEGSGHFPISASINR